MAKPLKIVLLVAAALLALLLVAAAVIAATFNPNDYKQTVIDLVQEKKQRSLSIPGEIKLTFFPRIGVDLGRVAVSEHRSQAQFASIERARVSLALMPLLSKHIVVDRFIVDGLRANITRFKDGTTNFDDLMSKEASDGEQVRFDIDGIDLSNSTVTVDDRQQQRRIELNNLNINIGKIANGVRSKFDLAVDVKANQPALDAEFTASSGFMIDFDNKRYRLDGLDADVKGKLLGFSDLALALSGDADVQPDKKQFAFKDLVLKLKGKQAQQTVEASLSVPKLAATDQAVSGGKLGGDATLSEGKRKIALKFSTPSFEGSPQAFRLPALTLDATVRDDDLAADVKLAGPLAGNLDKLLLTSPQLALTLNGKRAGQALDGTLKTALAVDLKAQTFDLSAIVAAFSLPNPQGGVLKLDATGHAGVDLARHAVSSAWKGKLDDSTFDAKLGLAAFSPLSYTFDIGIDRIDLDRYLGKPDGAAAADADKDANKGKQSGAGQPVDLAPLKALHANGNLRVGALKVHNLRAANARVGVRAAGGKLELNPLNASLYGGTAAGSATADAASPARFALRQNLAGINVGALLKDAIAKQPIDGKGNVQIDVTTRGATIAQMKSALDGSARLELRDGAVHGINVAQAVRQAKAGISMVRGDAGGEQAPQTGTASADQKTDFSELSGSFRIANGVARNDDLALKSPLLRVAGAGDINLGADRLDYVVKATVVSTLQGQGGPELQALKGVTVPVRLSGPFAAIGWKVDFSGIARDLAKKKIDEKKEEVKTKLEDKLKGQLKGLFGK
jgi:AsmA protein